MSSTPSNSALSPVDAPLESSQALWLSRILNGLVIVLIFYPALRAVQDVREYVTNVPHYDDFTFAEDWIKYREGRLTVPDLFSVHLEHRVTVPRLMALGAHIVGGKDLRWQNGYTLLLRLWSSRMNPKWALGLSAVFCVLAMLSFGCGPLAWLLPPFSIWFQRLDLGKPERRRLLGAWLVLVIVALSFQFHNYHNSAPKQFAYNYDEKRTALDTVTKSLPLSDPAFIVKALEVAATVLGGHLSRGLHMPNIGTAECIGCFSALLLLAVIVWLWRNLRDGELLRTAAPWALLGLFSLGTGLLISAGRAGLTKSGSIALEPRYASHAVPLTLALIALAWIIGQRLLVKWPALRGVGFAAGGALLMLTCVEWVYGELHMELWMNSRLQCKELMMFTDLVPTSSSSVR